MQRRFLLWGPILLLGLGFCLRNWPSIQVVVTPKLAPSRLLVVATGDIMLAEARNSGKAMRKHGPAFPFARIKHLLRPADIAFANLETPISTQGWPLPGKPLTFRARPNVIEALKDGGFDVLSLANNHSFDYEEPALLETIALLKNAGIGTIGGGANLQAACTPYFVERQGVKMAFLAYSDLTNIYYSEAYPRTIAATPSQSGVAPLKQELMLADVRRVRALADLVFVSLHWGVEDSHVTTAKQRQIAYALIDAGADAIFGHHPHVLQGIEFYRGKPIAYSLANCVFDQNDEANKQGMLLYLQYQAGKLSALWALPIYMYKKGQPGPATGVRGEVIRHQLVTLSEQFGTQCSIGGEAVSFVLPN